MFRAGKAGEVAELHLNDPMAIAQLQAAARDNSAAAYRQYAAITHRLNQQINLRGMFRFKRAAQPLPLDEVRALHGCLLSRDEIHLIVCQVLTFNYRKM